MEFPSSKKVRCVSFRDMGRSHEVTEVRVQAWESSSGTWQNTMIKNGPRSGHRKVIKLINKVRLGCSQLPQTSQIKNNIAVITYSPPLESELVCVDTVAEVTCKEYPFVYPTKGEYSMEMKCLSDRTWSNAIKRNEDYCKCAVECSGFCLGVGHKHKTSINNVKFLWESAKTQEMTWDDGCSNTNDSTYLVDLYRYYWIASEQVWSRKYLIGSIAGGGTHWIDSSIEFDVPDNVAYVPGLQIKYRWSQKTIVGSYSPDFVYPAGELEQVTLQTELPFFFDFSSILSSPDGQVDIADATLRITDTLTGTLFHESITEKRFYISWSERETKNYYCAASKLDCLNK